VFAAGFNLLARVERAMRRVAAFTFIGAGAFMLWSRVAAVSV
jgi:hypothetical protein